MLSKRIMHQQNINQEKQKIRQLIIQQKSYFKYNLNSKKYKNTILIRKYKIKQKTDYDKLFRKKLCKKFLIDNCPKCFNLKNSRECYLRVCDRKILI